MIKNNFFTKHEINFNEKPLTLKIKIKEDLE